MYKELKELSQSDYYPFHMPGHKRNVDDTLLKGAFQLDITEIDNFDNMHHPQGIIKELQERMQKIFGGDKVYFLVNGSSSGILSAISATVPRGAKILMARNSHKSAYNAAYIRELDVEYIYPDEIKEWGINGGFSPEKIGEALNTTKGIRAVFIPSPTYEGCVSDIRKIADICHSFNVPLIVDSAHGAHFGLYEPFVNEWNCPDASKEGADIVIESLHKTLPSFTQTAMVLINGNLVDQYLFERYYSIYQTSSPSYVFMAGADRCMDIIEKESQKRFKILDNELKRIRDMAAHRNNIKIIGSEIIGNNEIYGYDPTKLVVSAGDMTGRGLYDMLREEYHIQPEMALGRYCLLMTTFMDSEEGLARLYNALEKISENI